MIELLNSYRSGNINKKDEHLLFSELRDCLREIVLKIGSKFRTFDKASKFQTLDDIIQNLMERIIEKKIPSKNSSIKNDKELKSYLYRTVSNDFIGIYNKDKKIQIKSIDSETEKNHGEEDTALNKLTGAEDLKEENILKINRLRAIKKFEDCIKLIERKISERGITYEVLKERWSKEYGDQSVNALKKAYFDCRMKILKTILK